MLQLKVKVSTELARDAPTARERYVLGREVVDHPDGGVVLLREREDRCYS